ncbi:MAG: hypothetical protein U0V48_04665 [Anaerolineales bacterium]
MAVKIKSPGSSVITEEMLKAISVPTFEDHVARGCHLPHLPVDAAGDDRIGWVEVGINPRL